MVVDKVRYDLSQSMTTVPLHATHIRLKIRSLCKVAALFGHDCACVRPISIGLMSLNAALSSHPSHLSLVLKAVGFPVSSLVNALNADRTPIFGSAAHCTYQAN